MIDTHAHLYSDQFDGDRAEMISRAINAGVTRLYLPNIDSESIQGMLDLEMAFPQHCFAMMGLHPGHVNDHYQKELKLVEEWLAKRPFCAVGEIGLDYYWSLEHVEQQKEAFRTQIRWAKELNIPIVVHARDSLDDVISIIGEEQNGNLTGVLHCFSGTLEQAKAGIDLGFMLGVGGVLTYKKSGMDQVISNLDLAHLVLETDAPYLPPVPHRGKRNESSFLQHIAEKLAEVKGTTFDTVDKITSENALKLFKH